MEISIFVGICLIATASPGPAVFKVIFNSTNYGFKYSLIGIFGNITAITLLAMLSNLGIGAILQSSVPLFIALKVAGSLYLIYLGVKMLRSTSSINIDTASLTSSKSISALNLFLSSLLVGLSNPKAIIFFAALFPQFFNIDNSTTGQFILLTIIFIMCSFFSLSIYAYVASCVDSIYKESLLKKWVNRVFGSLMIGFGCALGVSTKT